MVSLLVWADMFRETWWSPWLWLFPIRTKAWCCYWDSISHSHFIMVKESWCTNGVPDNSGWFLSCVKFKCEADARDFENNAFS